MKNPQTILITGASSGLGRALAIAYASPDVTLLLTGRDAMRLAETVAAARAKGALVVEEILDITDSKAAESWILKMDDEHPVDLAIANAGISGGTAKGPEPESQVRNIFKTNLDGVLNTILPLAPKMIERKHGQIAITSSLAGFKGLPSSPAYSASKAAVTTYGESLRGSLLGTGVEVTVICPGYIKTPLSDNNDFPMPFLMSPEKAAGTIKSRLAGNPPKICFPLPMYWLILLVRMLPDRLIEPLLAKLPKKG